MPLGNYRTPLLLFVARTLLLPAGCAPAEKGEGGEQAPPERIYKTIRPILEKNCVSCHQGDQPAGNYDLSTYIKKTPDGFKGIVGPGSGTVPNAIAGNPNSRILTILGETSHAYYFTEEERGELTHWVVDDRLAYFWISGIHDPGWLNPLDPDSNFHGQFLWDRNYRDLGSDRPVNNGDLPRCSHCHGNDDEEGGRYGGGGGKIRGPSCVSCHGESPESCTTCHGSADNPAPPMALRWPGSLGEGAHQAHLKAPAGISEPVDCETCHHVPETFDDPKHIDSERPAEVEFSGKAVSKNFNAVWDREAVACEVYCHSPSSTEPVRPSPKWDDPDVTIGCTTCHGAPPPPPHPQVPGLEDCKDCHGGVTDGAGNIADPSLHINGEVQLF